MRILLYTQPHRQLPLPLQTPVAPPPLPPTQLLQVKPQLQQLPPLRPPVLPPLQQQPQQQLLPPLPLLSRKSLCRSQEGRPEDKQTPNLFTILKITLSTTTFLPTHQECIFYIDINTH